MSSSTPTNPSRRKAQCMAFGGLGTLFTLSGGILTPFDLALAQTGDALPANAGRPLFVQISDTHIGFQQGGEPRRIGHAEADDRVVTACRRRPRWPSIPATSRTCPSPRSSTTRRNCSPLRVPELHTVPGEHDVTDVRAPNISAGSARRRTTAAITLRSRGRALHRPRQRDALQAGQPAASATTSSRGSRRISRAARRARRSSFSHMPMGPSTSRGAGAPATRADDGAAPLRLGHRMNGHIHQIVSKVEGNVTFHTARSTAFRNRRPATAPVPLTVPRDRLPSMLGVTTVEFAGHPVASRCAMRRWPDALNPRRPT